MDGIRVATLNIWNRFGPWDERLPRLRASLEKLAPDIIGMQEVLRVEGLDQAEVVSKGLGYTFAWGVASEDHGARVGNAILSKWPISKSEMIRLPNGGTDEKRSIIYAQIDSPHGKLHVFCTHLNWKLHEGHVRQLQVRALADAVAERAPVGEFPPIVMGDFNAEPDSDEIRFMRGLSSLGGKCVYFADSFAAAGDGTPGFTFARRNPFAMWCREPNRRIDYVFVRGPDDRGRGEPLSARVCFDEASDGMFPSDHFGVIAQVSVK